MTPRLAFLATLSLAACAATVPPETADERYSRAVRACWVRDAGQLAIDSMSVRLVVTHDETGQARMVDVAADDRARMLDPRYRAFAERAIRATLNPRCGRLPLPPEAAGKVGTVAFRFTP